MNGALLKLCLTVVVLVIGYTIVIKLSAITLVADVIDEALPREAELSVSDELEYVIRPKDLLHIFVFEEPDLDSKVTVGIDGVVRYSIVGDFQVSGRTTQQVEDEISTRLQRKRYVRDADVTVKVLEP